ncbi:MAG: gamma-glutamylcyclotransferase [Tissierellia bacterium]|nr:gamma-glutamylcyclotransferase [Tissierellia bacterium]
MRRNYVAYGSNLNKMQMGKRCKNPILIGTSTIKDYQLLFKFDGEDSYLTIEKNKGSFVPVGIWSIDEEDEKVLDDYEDFPDLYYKKEMKLIVKDVKTGEESTMDCFVYIMDEERPVGRPSDFYFETCLEGYEDFVFDSNILFEALERSKE